MASNFQKVYQVAVILFSGADLLDFASPVGILSHINYSRDPYAFSPAFEIHHIARNLDAIPIGESKTSISPDMTLEEAYEKLDDFDILVIPGGPPSLVQSMATSNGPEVRFIKQFSTQPGKEGREERIAFSICDGSLFLGAIGALSGLRATSHHLVLDDLKELDGSIEVIDSTADGRARRYVDGGVNTAGVRIVTAGGVSCGSDASLYVAELKVGRNLAEDWAERNEYVWNRAKTDT